MAFTGSAAQQGPKPEIGQVQGETTCLQSDGVGLVERRLNLTRLSSRTRHCQGARLLLQFLLQVPSGVRLTPSSNFSAGLYVSGMAHRPNPEQPP